MIYYLRNKKSKFLYIIIETISISKTTTFDKKRVSDGLQETRSKFQYADNDLAYIYRELVVYMCMTYDFEGMVKEIVFQ